MSSNNYRGRFAPSPTGYMHLGNIWTALLAWLDTRSNSGRFVLRIEDLDPDRSQTVYAEALIRDLLWLGLYWDEGPGGTTDDAFYYQSQRRQQYQFALEKLQKEGMTYPCFCSRAQLSRIATAPHGDETQFVYPGVCKNLPEGMQALYNQTKRPAIRLMVPDCNITYIDGVYGRFSQNMQNECGDFVISRSDGIHSYQLAVVVDDAAMAITHVLRGNDLLPSTPRQILLYQLLGLPVPQFAHIPLLYSYDGHRLSKRQKDLTIAGLRQRGITAKQIIGYLAWKAGLTQEWESISSDELIAGFSLQDVSPGSVFIDETDFLAL